MKGDLAEARIAGRHDRKGPLRGLAIAVAVGAAATVASWSLLVAITVAGVGLGLGGLWLFRLYLDTQAGHVATVVPVVMPLTGDREYALRPRPAAIAVTVVSLLICLVAIRWPELTSIPALATVTWCAALMGLPLLGVVIKAVVLRQRIVVTGTHVLLPRSAWSRHETATALENVSISLWGPESSPILEIRTVDGREHREHNVGMTYLGESAFRELVAVMEQRLAATKV